jgi:hypothetical protein
LVVRVWNIQFLRCESVKAGPAVMRSHLDVVGNNHLHGRITNMGTTALKDVVVRGYLVAWKLGDIPPGTSAVDADPNGAVKTGGTPTAQMEEANGVSDYGQLENLADARCRQINAALAQDHRVCVYAQVDNAAPLATQQEPGALCTNFEIVRSLVTLEPGAATTEPAP